MSQDPKIPNEKEINLQNELMANLFDQTMTSFFLGTGLGFFKSKEEYANEFSKNNNMKKPSKKQTNEHEKFLKDMEKHYKESLKICNVIYEKLKKINPLVADEVRIAAMKSAMKEIPKPLKNSRIVGTHPSTRNEDDDEDDSRPKARKSFDAEEPNNSNDQ